MEFEFKQSQTDDDNLVKYADLLSAVFPNTKKYTFDFLKWQYLDNPHGKVVGYDAYFDGKLAAHYVTIPVLYSKSGKCYKGLLSLNTATSPEFQGKGLFTKLAERTYQLGESLGYEFVIGVANQNSTHGFIKKLGFQLIAPLDAYIYLFKNECDNNIGKFFMSSWDESSILWRMKNPENKYLSDGKYTYSNTDKTFIKACLSFKHKYDTSIKLGFSFKMSIGLNNTPSGFIKFKIPDKLKPSPLNLIYKQLKQLDFTVTKENIYFELIDFDAY